MVDETPINVLIVDDQDMVAQALSTVLSARPRVDVVATARSQAAALSSLGSHRIDVMVIEIRVADDAETPLIAEVIQRWPDTKVLVLSASSDDWSVSRAVEGGCHGYLLKDQHLDDLYDGIIAVHQGEAAFAPSVLSRVLKLLRPGTPNAELLTRGETDVLRKLADGLTTEQIAKELFVSVNTVRNRINSIIRKLNVHSRLEAVSFAIRTGLIRVG